MARVLIFILFFCVKKEECEQEKREKKIGRREKVTAIVQK